MLEKEQDFLQEKQFIKYIDDSGTEKEGWFVVISKNINYIEFETGTNILTLPWQRIIKVKKKKPDGHGGDEND